MYLEASDLSPFADIDAAKAGQMIADAEALAVLAAPCLADAEFVTGAGGDVRRAAVVAILRGAVLRWHEAGAAGRVQRQQTAGPFTSSESFDNTQPRRGMFWPSELAQLSQLCSEFTGSTRGQAWSVDTAWSDREVHSPLCSLGAGALYCSCGSDINGGAGPIYERWP